MNRKNVLKISVILPVIIGIIIGAVLFILGAMDDAPGLCLIGISAGFLLVMWGVHNTGILKKGRLSCILLFCFGSGSLVMSTVLQLDGELKESPALFFIGLLTGAVLLFAGIVKLIENNKHK